MKLLRKEEELGVQLSCVTSHILTTEHMQLHQVKNKRNKRKEKERKEEKRMESKGKKINDKLQKTLKANVGLS